MNKKRVELHLHTTMSRMDGVSTPEDFMNTAVYYQLPAVAICDNASVRAFPEAYDEAKRLRSLDLNLKLIYGCEIYMLDDSITTSCEGETPHATILVQNPIGRKNLYQLISMANIECAHRIPKTRKSELVKHREGLLIGSGCDTGELYHAVRDGMCDDALIEIATFYDYLEVVPIGNFEYYIQEGKATDTNDLIRINKKIIEIGEKAGKMVVAGSDARYVQEEDMIYRTILLHYKGDENYKHQPLLSMRTTDEMLEEFSYPWTRYTFDVKTVGRNDRNKIKGDSAE